MGTVSDQASKDFHPSKIDGRSSFGRFEAFLPGACRICGAATKNLLCAGCLADLDAPRQRSRIFSGCVVTGVYEYGPPLSGLIGLAKYGGHRGICRLLGSLIANGLTPPDTRSVLVPIPMPWPRLLWRGYNHAAELALTLGNLWGVAVDQRLLVRRGWQPPQRGLSRDARLGNLYAAFRGTAKTKGLQVVLLDDVCTTGATISSAARALHDAGAAMVSGVVLAHRSTSSGGTR